MDDPRTPTETLAAATLGAVSTCDEECDLCGRPATHDGHICSGCFDERWEFATDAEADEHARLMNLRLRHECIRCGARIDDPRFALGATECVDCKPHTIAA